MATTGRKTRRGRGAALGLLGLVIACGAPSTPRRPDVLLVVIDTLRADHTSAYGYGRDTTPRLARLASEGVRFDAAYAPGATTGPSHASLFTGLYPRRHGVARNGVALASEADTLAERLAAAGYATAGVVSSFVLDARFGFDQGFEAWEDDFAAEHATVRTKEFAGETVEAGFDRRAEQTTDRAIERLRAFAPGRPFFLFVHYFDPHDPYRAPPEWRRRFPPDGGDPAARAAALYDAEVAYTDAQLGRLLDELDALGRAETTLVVVTADHGEGLYDHGYLFHDVHLYEEAVRVPLVLRWPGELEAGRRVREPVSLVDLLPTLLETVGAAGPDGLDGQSLAAALRGAVDLDPERPIHLERRALDAPRVGRIPVAGEKLAVRRGSWKYIEAPEEGTRELFDLESDAAELRNLASQQPRRVRALARELERYRAAAPPPALEPLEPEVRTRLEALGYVE